MIGRDISYQNMFEMSIYIEILEREKQRVCNKIKREINKHLQSLTLVLGVIY